MLQQISKIVEKIIKSRLTVYINKHNVLHCNQFGFRSNRSSDAIYNINDVLVKNVDNKVNCLAVSIDLKKAFDTLNTNILLNKLPYFGSRPIGITIDILWSYLTNRKQYVCYQKCNSNLLSINICVPQESVLGPLLFLSYINDISDVMDDNVCILFADDTTFVFADKDLSILESKANTYIGYIYS